MFAACVTTHTGSPGAALAQRGTALVAQGRVAEARDAYRAAMADARDWSCWSNLSALAMGLEQYQEALEHAKRAIALAPGEADAWVNAAIASWRLGERRDAAKAMQHAHRLAPAHASAAMGMARMLRAIDRLQAAAEVLSTAIASGGPGFALQHAMGELMRVMERPAEARQHAREALRQVTDDTLAHVSRGGAEPGDDKRQEPGVWRAVLVDCLLRLQSIAAGPCLAGGAVRMHAIHGGLWEARKDIDIAIDADVPRDALLAAFAEGYRPFALQGQRMPPVGEIGVLGLVHVESGIPVDLLLQRRRDGRWVGSFGPPDHLVFDTPAFAIEYVACAPLDVTVPMPSPVDEYLGWIYGDDWREEHPALAGKVIPRRFLQKGLASPGLAEVSRDAAMTRALLTLGTMLVPGAGGAALAVCDQILAIEAFPEVESIRVRLQHLVGTDGGEGA